MTRNAPAASRIRISFTHGVHGFPVVRFLAVLNLIELMSCLAPCRKRKGAEIIKGATPKINGLGSSHATNIQNFICLASALLTTRVTHTDAAAEGQRLWP